jgi:hypothetical protein
MSGWKFRLRIFLMLRLGPDSSAFGAFHWPRPINPRPRCWQEPTTASWGLAGHSAILGHMTIAAEFGIRHDVRLRTMLAWCARRDPHCAGMPRGRDFVFLFTDGTYVRIEFESPMRFSFDDIAMIAHRVGQFGDA